MVISCIGAGDAVYVVVSLVGRAVNPASLELYSVYGRRLLSLILSRRLYNRVGFSEGFVPVSHQSYQYLVWCRILLTALIAVFTVANVLTEYELSAVSHPICRISAFSPGQSIGCPVTSLGSL